jgi:hypothetical protein
MEMKEEQKTKGKRVKKNQMGSNLVKLCPNFGKFEYQTL